MLAASFASTGEQRLGVDVFLTLSRPNLIRCGANWAVGWRGMNDLIAVGLTLGFFAACAFYVRFCGKVR